MKNNGNMVLAGHVTFMMFREGPRTMQITNKCGAKIRRLMAFALVACVLSLISVVFIASSISATEIDLSASELNESSYRKIGDGFYVKPGISVKKISSTNVDDIDLIEVFEVRHGDRILPEVKKFKPLIHGGEYVIVTLSGEEVRLPSAIGDREFNIFISDGTYHLKYIPSNFCYGNIVTNIYFTKDKLYLANSRIIDLNERSKVSGKIKIYKDIMEKSGIIGYQADGDVIVLGMLNLRGSYGEFYKTTPLLIKLNDGSIGWFIPGISEASEWAGLEIVACN